MYKVLDHILSNYASDAEGVFVSEKISHKPTSFYFDFSNLDQDFQNKFVTLIICQIIHPAYRDKIVCFGSHCLDAEHYDSFSQESLELVKVILEEVYLIAKSFCS